MSMNQFVRTNASSRGPVPGLVCTAFIHNGSYYGTEVEAYADGAFECWGMVDRDFLAQKFKQGWIAPAAPDEETISFHDLGQWKATAGEWNTTPEALHEKLLQMLKQLNPPMQDLVDFQGSDVQLEGGIRYAKMGMCNGKPVSGPWDSGIPGDSTWVFVREGDLFHLTALRVYANGKVDIDPRHAHESLVELASLPDLLASRKLALKVADGKWISIDGLGKCKVSGGWWQRTRKNFLGQVQDMFDQLNGRQGAIERCRNAFDEYMAKPDATTKEKLRLAYEAVPEHHRMYCGDMDTKDIPIRMALFGRKEIEYWSHRAVAKSQGDEELPDIDVPIIDDK